VYVAVPTGNEYCRIFALGGQTVEDANIGQSLASSGSVVVSSDVWTLCSHDKFFGNKIGKTSFMEVVIVSDLLSSTCCIRANVQTCEYVIDMQVAEQKIMNCNEAT